MTRLRYLLHLAWKSAWNRRGTLLLIVLSIALSSTLLLGIERLRTQVKTNFMQSASGTDLIVGPRGSSLQLVLYALFHLGRASNNMGWDTAQAVAGMPRVAWTIPVSLGDFHKNYPVVATTGDFYRHFRLHGGKGITFASGRAPGGLFDVVLGAEAAGNLGYGIGTSVVLSHGDSGSHAVTHDTFPFTVCGILAPTGTPIDRSLYIGLEAMEAIHVNWRGGSPHGQQATPENITSQDLTPREITALLVGLDHRGQTFAVQKAIGERKGEPLMAVLPGVALNQIWDMLNVGETALMAISALVTVVGLFGLAAAILSGLGERRRELAILRSAGARPLDIFVLLLFEGCLLVVSGVIAGLLALYGLSFALAPMLADGYGIFLTIGLPTSAEWFLVAVICLAGILASLIPAVRAYRMSLADGLTVTV